jgi:hypothetical protein
MNVDTLTIDQVNAELVSRNSRTSGTPEARRERLKRFLDFEKQKDRRDRFVQQVRADREAEAEAEAEAEMDGQQDQDQEEEEEEECCDGCLCDYEQEERVVRALLSLRDDADRFNNHLLPRVNVLEESYHAVVAENTRLNNHIENLELRLSHMENRLDSPPPLIPILQDSNPNWHLDASFYV